MPGVEQGGRAPGHLRGFAEFVSWSSRSQGHAAVGPLPATWLHSQEHPAGAGARHRSWGLGPRAGARAASHLWQW